MPGRESPRKSPPHAQHARSMTPGCAVRHATRGPSSPAPLGHPAGRKNTNRPAAPLGTSGAGQARAWRSRRNCAPRGHAAGKETHAGLSLRDSPPLQIARPLAIYTFPPGPGPASPAARRPHTQTAVTQKAAGERGLAEREGKATRTPEIVHQKATPRGAERPQPPPRKRRHAQTGAKPPPSANNEHKRHKRHRKTEKTKQARKIEPPAPTPPTPKPAARKSGKLQISSVQPVDTFRLQTTKTPRTM